MTHLVITYDAIRLLASQRRWQSIDFEDCARLVHFLIGEEENFHSENVFFHREGHGQYILSSKCNFKKSIVFDLTSFNEFNETRDYSRIITIFQKTIKLAVKIFEDIKLSKSERAFAKDNRNFAVVYPFSLVFGGGENFEVAMDRTPDIKRTEKRDQVHLLVYAAGIRARDRNYTYTIFRKALIGLEKSCIVYKDFDKPKKDVKSLKVNSLGGSFVSQISPALGYNNWSFHLTKNQLDFINKSVEGPQRLDGAAGTGKTLTLILKTIKIIQDAIDNNETLNLIFIIHSISAKKNTIEILKSNMPFGEEIFDRSHSKISLKVITLQEWCIDYLGTGILNTEYLDLNAEDSKQYQMMIIEEAFADALDYDFDSYKRLCSKDFINFIESSKREDILEMLQSEIGVTIKGRAGEDFDKYKSLPRLKYSIPLKNEADFGFLHVIYSYYQIRLNTMGQFDSDDISITALKQLDTPIWRRRRKDEGYDIVIIDETHLFNLNELSVFHHLTKDITKNQIIFAVDRSQAIGDKWLSDEDIFNYVGRQAISNDSKLSLNTVFRSSPEIINLAFEILSSGTSLFTTFENPLEKTISSFTTVEEKLSIFPKYLLLPSDSKVVEQTFVEAENLCKNHGVKRNEILIIGASIYFTEKLKKYSIEHNKPAEVIKSRGDSEIVNKAEKDNKFIISGIDYVGGLEFSHVIIVGVDKGRVPPISSTENVENYNFLNYAWHNRLYVAISRAKYSVIFLGDRSRGASSIFDKAIKKGCVILE